MTDSNGINITVPGSLNNGGNFTLNYDFGGNVTGLSTSAYAFVNNAFAVDTAFLGNTITGSQDFLAHQTSPLVNAAVNTQNRLADYLPQLFADLNSAATSAQQLNASLAESSIYAQQAIAQSSINANAQIASNSGGGGFCFITTAVCETLHLPDNNPILARLRAFRDKVLDVTENGHALVMEYYRIAPAICDAIAQRADKARIHTVMLWHFLLPAANCIDLGDYNGAFAYYCELVRFAKLCAFGPEKETA